VLREKKKNWKGWAQMGGKVGSFVPQATTTPEAFRAREKKGSRTAYPEEEWHICQWGGEEIRTKGLKKGRRRGIQVELFVVSEKGRASTRAQLGIGGTLSWTTGGR